MVEFTRHTGVANDLRGLVYGKGSFVAVGNNNTILQTLLRPRLSIEPWPPQPSAFSVGNPQPSTLNPQPSAFSVGNPQPSTINHQPGWSLRLTADPMRTYRVESTDILPAVNWTGVWTNYQTSWTTNLAVPSNPAGNKFYRVVFP